MSSLREPQRSVSPPPVNPQPLPSEAAGNTSVLHWIWPYVAIARPDHWVKNVFMVLGVLLAYFYHPELAKKGAIVQIIWAVATTCLIASSNYVLNEILDAPTDRNHPVKRHRPVPSGQVILSLAYAEWILLGVIGLAMASVLGWPFFFSGLFLLIMGLIYNVPPPSLKGATLSGRVV